jgi:hypothetical protein
LIELQNFDGEGDRLHSIFDTQIAALVKSIGASPRLVQVRELGYR